MPVFLKYGDDVSTLPPTLGWFTYPLNAVAPVSSLNLPYYNDVSASKVSPGAASLPISCHGSCLSMLVCLTLPCARRVGLCPFSELLCQLVTILTSTAWRNFGRMAPYLQWGAHHLPGAMFLGCKGDFISRTCQPKDTSKPTNIVVTHCGLTIN